MHYKKGSGLTRIGGLAPTPQRHTYEGKMEPNMVAFESYRIGSSTFLFTLNQSGKLTIYKATNSGGRVHLSYYRSKSLGKNYSHFLTMDTKKGKMLLAYSLHDGSSKWFKLSSQGLDELVAEERLETGWTDLDCWQKNQNLYLLLHKESGQTTIKRYEF